MLNLLVNTYSPIGFTFKKRILLSYLHLRNMIFSSWDLPCVRVRVRACACVRACVCVWICETVCTWCLYSLVRSISNCQLICCLFGYIFHSVFFSPQVMDNFVTSIKKTAITIITQEIFIDDPFTRVQNLKVLCNIISKRLHMFLYISKHVYLTKS